MLAEPVASLENRICTAWDARKVFFPIILFFHVVAEAGIRAGLCAMGIVVLLPWIRILTGRMRLTPLGAYLSDEILTIYYATNIHIL